MTGVDQLLTGRPSTPPSALSSARVTKVDSQGVWCTPDGGDERWPIGPCLGARHRPIAFCTGEPHTHPLQPLPTGTRVLLARTSTGPWIVSWEDTE